MKYFYWFKDLQKKYQIVVVAVAVIVIMMILGIF